MNNKAKVDVMIFWPSIIVLSVLTVLLVIFRESAEGILNAIIRGVNTRLDWVFEFMTFGLFIFLLWLIFGKYKNVKLGLGEREFSNFSYGAMLFCAGMGTSIMFWSIIEPMYYLQGPPFGIEAETAEATEWALPYAMFHWGISAWSIYAFPSIVIAYSFFNKQNKSLKVSQSVKGAIGKHADGWLGKVIDILVIWSLVGGLGTSLGLGVPMISAGISHIFGLEESIFLSIIIIAIWTVIYLTSASLGLYKGIKNLSNFNVYIALGLAIFVIIVGPTSFIITYFTDSFGIMAQNFLRMSFYTDAINGSLFPQDWTVFYFAWFAATAPFMGLFIARISQGRTLKSMAINILGWGSLGSWIYFAVFGGYTMNLQLTGKFDVLESMAKYGDAATVINVINTLPLGFLAVVFFVILGFIFLATSLDSASYVLASIASKDIDDNKEPPRWHIVLWGIIMAGLSISLLLIGGLSVVQTSAVVVSVPVVIIYSLLFISIIRWLKTDKHNYEGEE
ncbi:BCCT family transporter [Nosocomiicoccus ampullae]|uniref:BCCT family betaine/carnitine transporter n=1 Tax=Nosocomiicoccus ampullae TaxID=489910 RepID=A0A9Q2HFG6_9STAP|nr:BCCT family transporter [Nosocomiicoccus ampullae]MBB5176218.1 BCCT family betaine/carnitine transporter [Nosocomiicoccus ampullae]QYA47383.1 BCCT family transporter [Nosocomiicoccus ampullae]